MRPLRLVVITRRFWPFMGGTEKALADLSSDLVRNRCQVTILTVRWNALWPTQLVYGGVPVLRIGETPRPGWFAGRSMRWIARWLSGHRDQIDLVYACGLRHEAQAAVRAMRGGCPVVLRAEQVGREGDCLWQLEAHRGLRIKRDCLRADAFVAATPAIRRELEAAGYARDRIHSLADGVPILAPRTRAAQATARDALSAAHPSMRLASRAPLAIYAGRLSKDRGLDELLAAWESVDHRWPEARLWLAGQGPHEAELRHQIERRSLIGRVLLPGVFDHVEELLLAADLFVLPSREGRASLALLEAMAAGLPIIASDLPDHLELLAPQSACFVPRGDAAALGGAIGRLLEGPDVGAKLGEAAREQAVQDFSLARMTEEHLKLFESLV